MALSRLALSVVPVGAKFDGKLNLTPQGSQVVVVTLLVLCAVGFLGTMIFLWNDRPHAWVPGLFTSLTGVAGVWGWWLSHGQEATPTKVSVKKGGHLEIHTSAATLNSPETFQRLMGMLSVIGYRQPIPIPEGMLDAHMRPIPDSGAAAQALAEDVNKRVQDLQSEAIAFVMGPRAIGGISQPLGSTPTELPANSVAAKSDDVPGTTL
jgi:hypothetical protein